MTTKNFFLRLYLSAMMVSFASMTASAQVTIGSGNLPSQWSLLDLDAEEQKRGLHNARLTTAQRDALVTPASGQGNKDLAIGLMIYNIDNDCLEYWNRVEWISFCAGDTPLVPPDPCVGLLQMNTVFCAGETVANLTVRARAASGEGTIQWWDAETEGNLLDDPSVPLTTRTYWAGNCANSIDRVPVMVEVAGCAQPNVRQITAWTTAMYDFQEQTLILYHDNALPDDAIFWQWEVRIGTTGTDWRPIAGANQPTFTIPPHFMYQTAYSGISQGGTESIRELSFRVVRSVYNHPLSTRESTAFNMLFIRTSTGGYCPANADERGLAMSRSGSGTIRYALLNLGATNGNSLGDFYQWGRRKDGHQTIVWSKENTTPGITNRPIGGNVIDGISGTSLTATQSTMSAMGVVDGNGGQPTVGIWADRFITNTGGDWGSGNSNSYARWGRGTPTFTRSNAATSSTNWAFPSNNPCPADWRVPNHFELWDIHNGNGSNSPATTISPLADFPARTTTASNNQWAWRASQNGAVGGAIVFNQNGEALFLPAAGQRQSGNGQFVTTTYEGNYWSSATTPLPSSAEFMWFSGSGVRITPSATIGRANGFSVRCVKD